MQESQKRVGGEEILARVVIDADVVLIAARGGGNGDLGELKVGGAVESPSRKLRRTACGEPGIVCAESGRGRADVDAAADHGTGLNSEHPQCAIGGQDLLDARREARRLKYGSHWRAGAICKDH